MTASVLRPNGEEVYFIRVAIVNMFTNEEICNFTYNVIAELTDKLLPRENVKLSLNGQSEHSNGQLEHLIGQSELSNDQWEHSTGQIERLNDQSEQSNGRLWFREWLSLKILAITLSVV